MRLTTEQKIKIIESFSSNHTARETAEIMQIQPNTAVNYYEKIRKAIHEVLCVEAQEYLGENIVVRLLDDKNLAAVYSRQQIAVMDILFVVLYTNRHYYTVMVTDKMKELYRMDTRGSYRPSLYVYESSRKEKANVSIHRWKLLHMKVKDHDPNQFWKYVEEIMCRYNSVRRCNLDLFLKECEFKFRYRDEKLRVKFLRDWLSV
jgi:transposase